jgi:uncharacterized PurR-regulated membrane protein YhhQ (DUF165 family)
VLAAVVYVVAVLAANLTATLFLPVEVFPGTGVMVSVGTLIFGITFTQRDRMHHRGRRFVYSVIFLSALLNLLQLATFSWFWGAPLIEWFEQRQWEWLARSAAMLQENGLRVFVAFFIAILIGESANTEVYEYFRRRSWLVRVSRSNAVSIPLDSILFNVIAFAGSAFFPLAIMVKVILGEIVAKVVVSMLYAVVLPLRRDAP